MASLVDKIKHKVRTRSDSQSSDTSPSASRVGTQTPERPNTAAAYATPSPPRHDPFLRTSLENSAFHVSRGGSVPRKSVDSPARKPVPQSTAAQHRRQLSIGGQNTDKRDVIPERISSRLPLQETQPRGHGHVHGHGYSQSTGAQPLEETRSRGKGHNSSNEEQYGMVDDLVPERGSSKHADTSPTHASRKMPLAASMDHPQSSSGITSNGRTFDIPERPARNGINSEDLFKPLPSVPQNSNSAIKSTTDSKATSTSNSMSNVTWMGPMISAGQDTKPAESDAKREMDAVKYEAMAGGHLRLPEGFDLQDTERTHVYEQYRPAVTHERIIKQRTEIVREAISRDIHVHHYYTYVQPIKVVEVLPTRHFQLDLVTGEKVEIPEPAGWTMPVNLKPTSPNDSAVKGWSRHYLVNEEYPNGIREDPPDGFDPNDPAPVHETRTTREVARQ